MADYIIRGCTPLTFEDWEGFEDSTTSTGKYEHLVTSSEAPKDTFSVGFTLKLDSIVQVNGVPILYTDDGWTGVGSESLVTTTPLEEGDIITVWQ